MRYTDDGYISTEVELPKEGSRVEYKFYSYLGGEPGKAIFDGDGFVFDPPYKLSEISGGQKRLGRHLGYWRYLDTPAEEKRDSGHPGAFYGYLGELRDIVGCFSEVLGNFQGETDELLDSLDEILESEKLAKERDRLSQERWISAEDELPEPCDNNYYEVMLDGKLLTNEDGGWLAFSGKWSLPQHDPCDDRRWTSTKGTYYRLINAWQKSTPENLAKLASKEVVEVKTEDGKIYKGILCGHLVSDSSDYSGWHLGKPDCMYMEGGTARNGSGYCITRSVDGTWFRRLASKN